MQQRKLNYVTRKSINLIQQQDVLISLIPRHPPFISLRFAFSTVHKGEQIYCAWINSQALLFQHPSCATIASVPGSPQNQEEETGNILDKSCRLPAHHHVGRSHFSNSCRWFTKLSCNIGIISCNSTNYLQIRLLSSRHPQLCWVPWRTLYM